MTLAVPPFGRCWPSPVCHAIRITMCKRIWGTRGSTRRAIGFDMVAVAKAARFLRLTHGFERGLSAHCLIIRVLVSVVTASRLRIRPKFLACPFRVANSFFSEFDASLRGCTGRFLQNRGQPVVKSTVRDRGTFLAIKSHHPHGRGLSSSSRSSL